MPKLDKTYNITLDIKQTINNSIPQYYISDNDTSEIMITITDDKKPIQLDNVIVLMVAIAPDREKLYDFIDVRTSEEGLIYCNLKSQFKDLEGTWYARLMIISNEEKLVTDTFSYNVKTDDFIDMNDEVIDDDRYPLLSDIISRLSTIEITELSRQNIESIRVREEKIRVANENIRILNEQTRQTQHTTSLQSIDNKIVDIENRFRTMTASQQQDSEVIDARDGETSLHARLERDLAKGKVIEEKVEGAYITVNDSVDGYLTDIELLGNTVQDPVNLADIRSVGTLEEDGRYKMSILSCGKNLFDKGMIGGIKIADGTEYNTQDRFRSGFIKVFPSKNIKISINETYPTISTDIFEYDRNKSFVKSTNGWNVTLSNSTCYVRVVVVSSNLNLKVQLEYDNITQYEHQYNKSSILLPCQLEKVGDVRDRLFRREDGVWCIEKNFKKYSLDKDIITWSKYTSQDTETTYCFYSNVIDTLVKTNNLISNYLSGGKYWNLDKEVISTDSLSGVRFFLRLNKDKFGSDITSDKVNQILKEKAFYVIAEYNQEIIELPLDAQIQLNSFAGVTNIFTEDTVIEPTIKATVPKSLGASVNSLVNKTDILSQRIENVETLKTSQELEVSTDKGYVVCQDTRNGYVDDLKIEGKTLVNLLDFNSKTVSGSVVVSGSKATLTDGARLDFNTIPLKANNPYTLFVKVEKNTSQGIVYGFLDSDWAFTSNIKEDTYFIGKISPTRDVSKFRFHVYGNTGVAYISNVMLLEGDHTQNPPSYFEGLKSVGDGTDKIEVLSQNGNLFDATSVANRGNDIITILNSNTVKVTSANTGTTNYRFFSLYTEPNTTYEFSMDTPTMIKGATYRVLLRDLVDDSNINDNNYGYFENGLKCTFTTKSAINNKNVKLGLCLYSYVNSATGTGEIIYNNIQIKKVSSNTNFVSSKQNKKQILYQNSDGVYEKPILRSTGSVSDTIEKHSDGKYYFHKRCGEVVLNGSENWSLSTKYTNTQRFVINSWTHVKGNGNTSNVISDKFNDYPDSTAFGDVEGISSRINNTGFNLHILKTKLSSQDVEGFKSWLQSNPVTVVYQLATEEVYEVVNLDLDSYEGETSVIVDSGAISPKLSFKIASHIANTISVLKDRINYLEDKVINMFKAVLAGDVQTLAYELYPEDFKEDTQESEQLETVEGTELL